MKDSRCFICKFHDETRSTTQNDVVFDARGNSKVLPLCYVHSVELFKSGQRTFLNKHKDVLDDYLDLDMEKGPVGYFQREKSWF